MSGAPFEEVNSLSLLAHKVASQVFDLSSRQINVSIRDQVVRAQQLVRDLHKADPKADSLLVVGMGAAGMTAAMSACEAGFANVCVVDVAAEPFSLFRGVQSRYVGPYMYEWPSDFHGDQSYPGHGATPWSGHGRSPLRWNAVEPLSADAFAKALRASLGAWLTARATSGLLLPLMRVGVDAAAVRKYLLEYANDGYDRWVAAGGGVVNLGPLPELDFASVGGCGWSGVPAPVVWPPSFTPDYIVLAAGMGVETSRVNKVTRGKTPRFWADDRLKRTEVANQHVVILGGGDGAMQDAVRSLTRFHHPLSFVRHLEAKASVRELLHAELPALLSADRQMRQHNGWSADAHGYALVDAACLAAARRLAHHAGVCERVHEALRKGRGHVALLVRAEHFDKAYLLNRFVIYLLAQCVNSKASRRRSAPRMGFTLKFGTQVIRHVPASGHGTRGYVKTHPAIRCRAGVLAADHVVVRFGIRADSIPGLQMIQLSDPTAPGANSKQRTTLSRVELPFAAM